MIVEYNSIYDEQIKDLFVELQRYITDIDKEKYNILTEEYREKYFDKIIDEIEKYHGKMLLEKQDEKIIGLVVGIINNEEINGYDFKAPKRGRILELIVSQENRNSGIGSNLLHEMEKYLKS